MKENQIHILLLEAVSHCQRFGRRINQSKIRQPDAGSFEPVTDDSGKTFEALPESSELWPMGMKIYTEQPDAERSGLFLCDLSEQFHGFCSKDIDLSAIP